jgi:hypothetical protein
MYLLSIDDGGKFLQQSTKINQIQITQHIDHHSRKPTTV